MKAAPPQTTTVKGREGEDVAVLLLEREGYQVVARNARTKGGELDVVAWDGSILCFIEVRRRKRLEDALISIDARKQRRITRAAYAWLLQAKHKETPTCRFDVVVLAGLEGSVFRNAFEGTE